MATTTFVLLSLFLLIFQPSAGTRWSSGQLVRAEPDPSRVYEETEEMDKVTTQLEESVNFVHQYLVSMVRAAQEVDTTTDIWRKRALLRVVQNRLEELRIGRKEVKRILENHRKTVKKVSKRAEKLRDKVPLWYDGIREKLKRAQRVIAQAKSWLDSGERIVRSEEALLERNVEELEFNKLPPLTTASNEAPSDAYS